MRLLGVGNVAGKQNHARRLNAAEQGSEPWRHLRTIEADDEESPGLPFTLGLFLAGHCAAMVILLASSAQPASSGHQAASTGPNPFLAGAPALAVTKA